jgi:hypothetical protein
MRNQLIAGNSNGTLTGTQGVDNVGDTADQDGQLLRNERTGWCMVMRLWDSTRYGTKSGHEASRVCEVAIVSLHPDRGPSFHKFAARSEGKQYQSQCVSCDLQKNCVKLGSNEKNEVLGQ